MNDDYWTALAMRTYGGSFVQKLGAAFAAADDLNRMILIQAWPDYWNSYVPRGQKMKAEDEAKDMHVWGEMLDVLGGASNG